jgi:prevent-host-death family protein
MKTISARQANQGFSALLSRVERGEEILITKRGRAVAMLRPYRPSVMTPARQRAINQAIKVMAKGLPWGSALRQFKRDEMHDR